MLILLGATAGEELHYGFSSPGHTIIWPPLLLTDREAASYHHSCVYDPAVNSY
jgi:hypothetical protein